MPGGIFAASSGLMFCSAPRTRTETSGSDSTMFWPTDSNSERCAARADVRTTARNGADDTTPVMAGSMSERTLTRLGRCATMASVIRDATYPATRGSERVAATRRANGSGRMMPRAAPPTISAVQTAAAPRITRMADVLAERAVVMG